MAVGRVWARTVVVIDADKNGRMTRMLPLIPRRGYDTLMTGMFMIGTAVDTPYDDTVHVILLRSPDADPASREPLSSRPEAQIYRVDAPMFLSDMYADIGELH